MFDYFERLCPNDSEFTKHLSLAEEDNTQDYNTYLYTRNPTPYGRIETPSTHTIIRSNGYTATSWSDKDLEEMAHSPCPEIQPGKASTFTFSPEREEEPEEIQELIPQEHVRIQITEYHKGEYVKGNSGNFEVQGSFLMVFDLLSSLISLYPKQKADNRVRIQLQNKVDGKMVGGKNIALSNTTVNEILPQVQELLDDHGLVSPAKVFPEVYEVAHRGRRVSDEEIEWIGKSCGAYLKAAEQNTAVNEAVGGDSVASVSVVGAVSAQVVENKGVVGTKIEDGSHKVSETLVFPEAPTPKTYHSKKIQKGRASRRRFVPIVIRRAEL